MQRRQLLRSFAVLVGLALEPAEAQTPGVKDTRLTKAQANYSENTSTNLTCGACMYFYTPDGCKVVQGSVKTDATCDLYGQ